MTIRCATAKDAWSCEHLKLISPMRNLRTAAVIHASLRPARTAAKPTVAVTAARVRMLEELYSVFHLISLLSFSLFSDILHVLSLAAF